MYFLHNFLSHLKCKLLFWYSVKYGASLFNSVGFVILPAIKYIFYLHFSIL